ncbi:MAG: adenosine deaminase [Pseudomonadota bacterium]
MVFDAVKSDPSFLRIFLRNMPKGGDLHNHLSGTPYAEEFLEWAAARDFCVDPEALTLIAPPCESLDAVPVQDLFTRQDGLYDRMIDTMSARPLITGKPSPLNGHQQFFGSFAKFFPISSLEQGQSLASSRRIASDDNVLYQELMYNPASIGTAAMTEHSNEWSGDFAKELKLLRPELSRLVAKAQADASSAEAEAIKVLGCEEAPENKGCEIKVRYNCFGLRLIPEPALFRQLAQCFALIEADPRFFGVSLVQPEDHPIAIKQYDRHMDMIAFFKAEFPSAQISLHAGELTLGLVSPAALRDHIAKAIHIAGSERIGHGVDITYEDNSRETLAHMSENGIAVEINLSSNAVILGIAGDDHPFNLYSAAGVPTVLSTDDLGVLRSDMTQQYLIAARDHGLDYLDLKSLSRNSLHYAFLPGSSLWKNASYDAYVEDCTDPESASCVAFRAANEKAAMEFELEQRFSAFEADFAYWALRP